MSRKGSITIFLSLSLTMILSLIFTLLESARTYGLQSQATAESRLVLESEMAQYNRALYEQYHMYFLEANAGGALSLSSLESAMQVLGMENLQGIHRETERSAMNLYAMNLTECQITQKELVTDNDGQAFAVQAAAYMKSRLLLVGLEALYENAQEMQKMTEENGDVDRLMQQADDTLEDLEAANEEANAASPSEPEEPMETVPVDEDFENPMDHVKDLKNKAILSQVIDNVAAISDSSFEDKQDLLHRQLYRGNYTGEKPGVTDKLLFKEYLLEQFGSYRKVNSQGVLKYEQEYLICGKSSDEENLTKIVERLLAIREVANYVFLHKDTEKVALAYSMALLIGGPSLNPAVIKVIQEGIIAAWAYTESVQDVKTLLKGGKISMIKEAGEWGSNLQKLSESTYEQTASEKLMAGIDYAGYLRILMYMTAEKTLAMRSLNLMEQNLRQQTKNPNFRMDCMISTISVHTKYEARPLFFGLFGSGNGWNGNYCMERSNLFGYQ